MADKKKQENQEQQEAEESKSKSGGLLKTVLMIGLPLMIVQTGVAYFLVSKVVKVPQAVEEVKEEEPEPEEEGPSKLYVIEDVIINPAGTSGSRFLNATVALEYADAELEQELTENEVQIRDILINILASKTIDELDGPEDRLKLKQEILDKCNEYLKKGKLKRVYFSNFIMQ